MNNNDETTTSDESSSVITDNDYDTSSSISTSINTEYDHSTNQESISKEQVRRKSKRKCFAIGFGFIVGNIILILVNVILVIIVMKVLDHSKSKNKTNEYQMIYYDDTKDVVVKEYVEDDTVEDFEGDFYPLKDWKNGIIAKLDSEGELYKMCSDECKCYVECISNMDCGNGMECNNEFKCELTDGKKRRETLYENERKVAQVAFVIPLAVCTFGLFTSMFFADKYAKSYFENKCSENCPTDSVEVEAEIEHHLNDDEYHLFLCRGMCKIGQLYDFLVKDDIKTGEITLKPDFDFNVGEFINGVGKLCNSVLPEKDIYAVDEARAKYNFVPWGRFECQIVRLKNPEGFTKWVEKKMCDLDENTVKCFRKNKFVEGE